MVAAHGQIVCEHTRVIDRSHHGPGTGKSHMATALGVQVVEHHRKKVRFFGAVDLVNALEQEKAMNKAGQLADRLLRLEPFPIFENQKIG